TCQSTPTPTPTPTPPPPACSSAGASGLCSSLTCCPGLTEVTGYYGYCQCSSTQACAPNSTRCDGTSIQETCKADGSGYDRATCQSNYLCSNNACKPAPITKCSSFGSCYPTNYTCEKDYGQLNCGSGNKCGGHCSLPSLSPKSSTDYPQEGRYTQQLIPQTTQTCQQAGGDVCLSRRLCLTEEGKIISSSQSDCREEEVCCSFPKKINSETANSKDETDDFTSTSNAAVPSTAPVFFSDQYHELPPSTYLPTQIVPTMIILHWDGQGGSPYGWTTNGTYRGLGFETSAHFAVGIDGVLQMLPMTNTTVARSQGAIGRNDQAINIEMAGWNFDATPPTQKEIDASINLIIKLMQAYHLTINDVFGHSEQDTVNSNGQACVIGVDSDCRDRYKSDPGKEFMDKIRKEVANRLVSQSPAAPEQAQSQTDSTNTTGHYMQTAASINNNPIAEQCLVCIGTDCQTINKPIYMEDVGCGPTAVANILHNYGIEANPLDLAKRIPANQLFCNGSALSAQVNLLQSYGLQVDGPPPSLYSLDKFTDNNDSLLVVGNVDNIDHFTTIQIKEADGQQTLTLIDSYFSDAPLNCRIVSAQELSCSGKNNEGKSVTVSINYETMFIVNL
ncbi:N-acetylmuramoyl-L-alanine amidase, partial [Patescibacteria group bacterium]|nr:N-acetylmuramoyl-L-alanine amidase [Patescibacteria group bacterium]